MKLRRNLGLLAWIPDVLVAVLEVCMHLTGLESDEELDNQRKFSENSIFNILPLRLIYKRSLFSLTS